MFLYCKFPSFWRKFELAVSKLIIFQDLIPGSKFLRSGGIHTNEFTSLNNSRKLACYCGVAPFPYQSGTSIRGKTRVHSMANKKLKTNLHMASLTAVKLDHDLKAYYQRKLAEGKSKMSVFNAVKCKMLARVVAVVNKQTLYVKKSA